VRLAVVLPHPPLLVPELTGEARAEVADLRGECGEALTEVRQLLVTDPSIPVVLLGAGSTTRRHPATAWGSLAGFGPPLDVPTMHPGGRPCLPLSLTIGRWLLEESGIVTSPILQEIDLSIPSGESARLGEELATATPEGSVWVVLADGSACRSPKSPGGLDPRAGPFDRAVGAALATGDAAALCCLDRGLCDELLVGGRVPLQVLGAASASQGPPVRCRVLFEGAPFGVGYTVAVWYW
jgi:hypothetical protein